MQNMQTFEVSAQASARALMQQMQTLEVSGEPSAWTPRQIMNTFGVSSEPSALDTYTKNGKDESDHKTLCPGTHATKKTLEVSAQPWPRSMMPK